MAYWVLLFVSTILLQVLAKKHLRIAGGSMSTLGEFPHLVAIGDRAHTAVWCGGSLIAPNYVLTAAHCWDTDPTDPTRYLPSTTGVHIGKVNWTESSPGIFVNVDSVILHPQYVTFPNVSNDVCLVKLAQNVSEDFANNIAYANLLSTDTVTVGQKLWVAGWGKRPGIGQIFPNINDSLAYLPQNQYKNLLMVSDPNIYCANFDDFNATQTYCIGIGDGNDTCQADSGGPAMFKYSTSDLRWTVAGVVSYGPPGCGLPGNTGVYSKVSYYLSWIESVTGPLVNSSSTLSPITTTTNFPTTTSTSPSTTSTIIPSSTTTTTTSTLTTTPTSTVTPTPKPNSATTIRSYLFLIIAPVLLTQ